MDNHGFVTIILIIIGFIIIGFLIGRFNLSLVSQRETVTTETYTP